MFPSELITKSATNPILLMFTASWCAPAKDAKCDVQKRRVYATASESTIYLLDVELQPARIYRDLIAKDSAVPQFIVMDKEQNVLQKMRGATEASKVCEFLRSGN